MDFNDFNADDVMDMMDAERGSGEEIKPEKEIEKEVEASKTPREDQENEGETEDLRAEDFDRGNTTAGKIFRFVEKIGEALEKRPTLYYYVSPCPNCGSRITGRYVRKPHSALDERYIKEQSYSHGEIIRFAKSVPIENAFCTECGHEWPEHIYGKLWPVWKVEEEKIVRGTKQMYEDYNNQNPKKKHFYSKFTGFFS